MLAGPRRRLVHPLLVELLYVADVPDEVVEACLTLYPCGERVRVRVGEGLGSASCSCSEFNHAGLELELAICACNVRPTEAAVVHGPAALVCTVESARPVVADQLGLRGLVLLPGMHLALEVVRRVVPG